MSFQSILTLGILLKILFSAPAFGGRILVLYALEADRRAIEHEMGPPRSLERTPGRTIRVFEVNGYRVDVMRMGSGPMETAVAVAHYNATRRPDWCFSVGPVGALTDAFVVGQWVQVAEFAPWQRGPVGDGSGHPQPEKRSLPAEGAFVPPGDWKELPVVCAASGEAFIAHDGFRRELAQRSGCPVVEMNLAGLMAAFGDEPPQGAHFRIVSDRADERAREDFAAFIREYDGAGGRSIVHLIRSLPPDPRSPRTYENLSRLIEEGL